MSPLKLRASLWLLLPLLLPGGCLLAAARGDQGAAGGVAEAAREPAGGSTGRFLSPEGHACSWQLLPPAPGPAAGGELWLRCKGPDGERRRCAYRAEPARCAADAARRARYWKRVLGRLRRRRRPCRDPAPLRARLCAGQRGRGAELRLVAHAGPPGRPTAAGFPGASDRGRPRERAVGSAARVPPPPSARPKGKPSEKKAGGGKRKAVSDPDQEPPWGTGPDPDGLDGNAKLTETYCAEKWHSLCNFFVSFWNG